MGDQFPGSRLDKYNLPSQARYRQSLQATQRGIFGRRHDLRRQGLFRFRFRDSIWPNTKRWTERFEPPEQSRVQCLKSAEVPKSALKSQIRATCRSEPEYPTRLTTLWSSRADPPRTSRSALAGCLNTSPRARYRGKRWSIWTRFKDHHAIAQEQLRRLSESVQMFALA